MLRALKLCSFVFLFLFSIFAVTVSAFGEKAPIEEWNVSGDADADDVTASIYSLDGSDGGHMLVISGFGNMTDFSDAEASPWHSEYSESIISVTVKAGIDYIGENSFYSLSNLESIFIESLDLSFPVSSDNVMPSFTVICAHKNSTGAVYANLYGKNFKIVCSFSDAPCEICGFKCDEPTPSCATNGICQSCKTTHGDTLRHVSNGVFVEEVASTCEFPGVKAHSLCRYCGIPLDEDGRQIEFLEIPPLSHSLGEWTDEILPTCDREGYVGHYRCSRCGDCFDKDKLKLQGIISAASGHRGGVASCSKLAVCEVCGKAYGSYDIDNHDYSSAFKYDENGHRGLCACGAESEAIPHAYTETVIQPATELFDGIMKRSCPCGYEEKVKIPKISIPHAPDIEEEEPKVKAPAEAIVLSVLGVILLTLIAFIIKRIISNKSHKN